MSIQNRHYNKEYYRFICSALLNKITIGIPFNFSEIYKEVIEETNTKKLKPYSKLGAFISEEYILEYLLNKNVIKRYNSILYILNQDFSSKSDIIKHINEMPKIKKIRWDIIGLVGIIVTIILWILDKLFFSVT